MLSLPGGDAFCNGAKIRIKNDIRACRFSAGNCPVAFTLLVIRLCANWAAVRPSVQVPPCHSGFRAGILGCLMLGYCIALPPRHCHPRTRLPRPRVVARGDGAMRRLCHRAPLHCRPLCHSGLRAGILGGFMRGIVLRYRLALPPKTPCRSTG